MKFSQLMEYNKETFFIEKSCIKCGRETIPKHFSEESKLSIYLDQ